MCPVRVKEGQRNRYCEGPLGVEHMFSGTPPIAAGSELCWHLRSAPEADFHYPPANNSIRPEAEVRPRLSLPLPFSLSLRS
jgi:hypothetical protein